MEVEDKMPVLFLTHGAGPCWYIDESEYPRVTGLGKNSNSADFLRNLVSKENIPKPKAMLIISAHWEEDIFTVLTNPTPPLYFDYSGYPPDTYKLKWPASGATELAAKVKKLLESRGIPCKENATRGVDHGVFVPLKLIYPDADIPVTQLSLKSTLDFNEHIAIGGLLSPLRKQGVLIVGSGAATHNGTENKPGNPIEKWAEEFKELLNDIVSNSEYKTTERRDKLVSFCSTELFNMGHPRTEHFLPLPLIMGTVDFTPGKVLYDEIAWASFLQGNYMFQ